MKIITTKAEMGEMQSSSLVNIEGIAYSGGPLSQPWCNTPIYVDLKGLEARQQVVLLYSHTNDPHYRLGVVTARIDENQLLVTGGIDPDVPGGKELIAAGKKIPWQLSVGVGIDAETVLKEGQSMDINGRTIEGPALIATKSTLQEVSIVAVGADAATQLNILASLNINHTGEHPMPIPAPDIKDIQAEAAKAERERITELGKICQHHPDIKAKAVSEGWNLDKARLEVLDAIQASYTATTPYVNAGSVTGITHSILQAAACQALHLSDAKIIAATSQKDLEMADKRWHGRMGLQELIIEAAAANGNPITGHSLNSGNWYDACHGAIRAAAGLTSIDLGGILGDIINRELLEGYGEVENSWNQIARITSVKDFRSVTSYRLVSGGGFQKVLPGGELQHGTYSEKSFSNKAETYGKMVGVSRTDIINDDLGALKDIPNQLGLDAAMTLNEVFWAEFMSNSGFYTDDNKNLLTGNALSIEGLGAAVKKFRELKDESGRMLGIAPAILLVGGSNEVLANKLFADAQVIAIGMGNSAKTAPSGNPFTGKYKPVCSVYLEDTGINGYSTTAYYLLAKPAFRAAMQVAFLNGNRTPTVQSNEMDFNTLGMQFRAYYDFGCAKMDPLAGIKVTGA